MTLLLIIVMTTWSMHMKSAITSDLIFFNTLLRLVICVLEDFINLTLFSLLIGMITCFMEGLFIIMFNLGLGFPIILIILWILLILLTYSLRKIFLIFRISLVFGNEAYTYNFPIFFFSVGLVLFLRNLEISLIFLGVFIEIRGGNFAKLTSLLVILLSLAVSLVSWIFRVNLDATCYLNDLLFLLVTSVFQPNSYIVEIKF